MKKILLVPGGGEGERVGEDPVTAEFRLPQVAIPFLFWPHAFPLTGVNKMWFYHLGKGIINRIQKE